MMITDSVGLYVHIPFCVSKCKYCDFSSFSGVDASVREKYIARLCEEISLYLQTPKIKVDTVFFGGGTPSLLAPQELEKITEVIRSTFAVSADAEFTLEANPKTLTREKLSAYASCGVNRISIGMQSVNEKELKTLGRIHNFDDFVESYTLAKKAEIENINVDIMYAIPHQTKESFIKTLDAVIALEPSHISAYGLILEEGTPFFEMKDTLPLPSEDEECDMYEILCKKLSEFGYAHYEISNFAKPQSCCRHNLKYWNDEEYIGIGLAAHSYYGKKRYYNSSLFSEYLADNYIEYRIAEEIDKSAEAYEYAMMHLRLSNGFSLAEYRECFGKEFICENKALVEEYERHGLLRVAEGRIFLTEKGFYLSNTILSEIL